MQKILKHHTGLYLFGWFCASVASIVLIVGSLLHTLPLNITEVLGFVTGALCVWLVVKQNIWNWPIGIANNIFFIVLFWRAHLFADMGLQWIYILLSIFGWYWWLHGGKNKSELMVARTSKNEALLLLLITSVSTFGMTAYLRHVNDAAPFLDALTTVMSLVAQYMLTKKLLENWYVWIAADVIYVNLYVSRHLQLTAVLYFLFLCMCVKGLQEWRQSYTPTKVRKASLIQA